MPDCPLRPGGRQAGLRCGRTVQQRIRSVVRGKAKVTRLFLRKMHMTALPGMHLKGRKSAFCAAAQRLSTATATKLTKPVSALNDSPHTHVPALARLDELSATATAAAQAMQFSGGETRQRSFVTGALPSRLQRSKSPAGNERSPSTLTLHIFVQSWSGRASLRTQKGRRQTCDDTPKRPPACVAHDQF
jgi:hypothetical protein